MQKMDQDGADVPIKLEMMDSESNMEFASPGLVKERGKLAPPSAVPSQVSNISRQRTLG